MMQKHSLLHIFNETADAETVQVHVFTLIDSLPRILIGNWGELLCAKYQMVDWAELLIELGKVV